MVARVRKEIAMKKIVNYVKAFIANNFGEARDLPCEDGESAVFLKGIWIKGGSVTGLTEIEEVEE